MNDTAKCHIGPKCKRCGHPVRCGTCDDTGWIITQVPQNEEIDWSGAGAFVALGPRMRKDKCPDCK